MKTSLYAALLTVLIALSTGCVAQSKYDQLDQAYRKVLEQNTELQARIDELTQQIKLLEAGPRGDRDRIAQLEAERQQLMDQLAKAQAALESLGAKSTAVVMLDPETDKALRDFAEANSDLVEYDAARGMVKFRSDLTFGLGSADLTAGAQNTLARLATLLNNPATQKYEIRIVGHTDSVPVSRPATKAKHPNNWYLSVHRAISVRDAIEKAGVAPIRTAVGGYGMYRPIAPNAKSGAETNRRVEVYLVAMTPVNEQYLGNTAPGSAPAPAPAPAGNIPLK
jgi:flagellar motor protein MotB